MFYASIRAQKKEPVHTEAVSQKKVSVFRCLFLDADKSDVDTRHLKPAIWDLKPLLQTWPMGGGFPALDSYN